MKYAGFSDWFVERQRTPITRKASSYICFQKTKSEGLNVPSDLLWDTSPVLLDTSHKIADASQHEDPINARPLLNLSKRFTIVRLCGVPFIIILIDIELD